MEKIEFNKHVTQQPIEVHQNTTDNKYVLNGQDNLYPNFLLKLYNNSPLHKGITNSKLDYIKGEGLKLKNGEAIALKPNASDSFEEFSNKLILDYIIFNAFAVEVIYNKLGVAIQWVHVPVNKLRTNRSKSKFWYCNDWYTESRNLITYDRWVAGDNTDLKSKIYYYSAYSPSVNNVYPIPTYSGAIVSIETDIKIRDFHINNIENSFSVSSIISFFNGEPNDEVKKAVQNKISNSYTGSNGGKFLINYSTKDGKGAEVQTLSPSDWDKAFEQLKQDTLQDILVAHSATSPMLFGIKTEGQLGGASELETAFEIFKNLYVKGKRNELESALNKLFRDSGLPELEFKDSGTLFNQTLSETLKVAIMTKDELRESYNLPKLNTNSNPIISTLNDLSPIVANKLLNSLTSNEIRAIAGLLPLADGNGIAPPTEAAATFSADVVKPDINLIKHLGLSKDECHVFKKDLFHAHSIEQAKAKELEFSDDTDIDNYLIKEEITGKDIDDIKASIRKDLGINITVTDLESKINKLIDTGMITTKVSEGKYEIKPTAKALENIRRVEVMYSYEVRAGYGAEIIDTTRDFCRELIQENKFFSRADLQTMSAIWGYDVFNVCGGWYFNPNKQEAENHCRHKWVANTVVRKVAK